MEKSGPEEVLYEGNIFQVIKQSVRVKDQEKAFEIVRRSPGVRLMIVKNGCMLITKEFRYELNGYDYRLPGGKVFDTLEDYKKNKDQDMLPFAQEAAKKECREETGLIASQVRHFATSQAGATVEWDLYYFVVEDFEESADGQELEAGENIEVQWKTFEEVQELCKNGNISEDRSLGMLFRFFLQSNVRNVFGKKE